MPRRPLLLPVAVASLVALAACTTSAPDADQPTEAPSPGPEETEQATEEEQDEALVALLADVTDPTTVLPFDGPVRSTVALSEQLFAEAPVAVVAPAGDADAQLLAASTSVALGAPLLLDSAGEDGAASAPVTDELDRLGVVTVLTVGGVAVDAGDAEVAEVPADEAELGDLLGVPLTEQVVAAGEERAAVAALDPTSRSLLVRLPASDGAADDGDPAVETEAEPAEDGAAESTAADGDAAEGSEGENAEAESAEAGADGSAPASDRGTRGSADGRVPLLELPGPADSGLVLLSGGAADVALAATARAAGWDVVVVPGGDPRVRSVTVQAVAAADPERVVAVGSVFGEPEDLEWKVRTAATGVELPGGGQTLFPGKRMIALYGTPSTPVLGLLGEQDLSGSVRRAQEYASMYEPLTEDVVVPAFEIIVTIASAGAGADGQYSNRLPAESFVPWVEGAQAGGVYVVLDLQPGRTDFLTQAKEYEQLLLYPNVGLALDPEWRLLPDQVHLRQIGHVEIDEVNAVTEYLADLTREHSLPQKLLILHQFRLSMIRDRDRLDTSRDEVAVLIHADGQGSQPAKQDTWRALRANAPEGVWWGWKNFIDEDEPMLTPEQTFGGVDPVPDFVSYQ